MLSKRDISSLEADECKLASGQRVFIHLFRPEDAPGIGRLFQAVYGDQYPVKRFYRPEELVRALETGDNYSIVIRKEDGQIIGHEGFFRSSPYRNLYETGANLVLPEYRKEGLNQLLLHHAYDRLAPALEVEEVWGEAVCNHIYMQRTVKHFKFVETGLEVDLMPAEAYAKEKSASGRVTCLLAFRSYIPRPHTVYLPSVYENALRSIYSRLDERRTLQKCSEAPPAGSCSKATVEIFEFPQVARVAFTDMGKDFGIYLEDLEKKILAGKIKVIQVWVNLACPWVESAVETLRGQGYFFGAVLPRWFNDDGLLMQKVLDSPGWEAINLFSDWAKELLRIVRNDWEEVGRS